MISYGGKYIYTRELVPGRRWAAWASRSRARTRYSKKPNPGTLVNAHTEREAIAMVKRIIDEGRGRENPSTTTVLVIGGGLALVGVAAYFILRKPASSTPPQVSTSAPAPQLPPAGGSAVVYTANDGTTYTRDHACQVAQQLAAIGHQREADFWAKLCTDNGGVVA